MLVLSRRTNETICFPELGITVKIMKVKGKTVGVGIEAPDEIQILRGELVEAATSFNNPQALITQVLQGAVCPNPATS